VFRSCSYCGISQPLLIDKDHVVAAQRFIYADSLSLRQTSSFSLKRYRCISYHSTMVVCKFFQQGNCKFGARCNFEHPRHLHGGSSQTSHFGGSFGAKSNVEANDSQVNNITSDTLKTDFTTERPQWPFSSYCPVKYGHANLLKDQDLSFEEVRAGAYEALQKQSMPQYEQDLNTRANSLNGSIQAILNNLGEAVRVSQRTNTAGNVGHNSQTSSQSTLFGTPQSQSSLNAGSSAFGNSSVFGGSSSQAKSSVFGGAAPAQSSGASPFTSSAFNTSSPFAATATSLPSLSTNASSSSAFGVSSTPTSAFGAPSKLSSVFSAPSTSPFGSTSTTSPAFGTTNPVQSAFGTSTTTSPFGGQTVPASAFGNAQTTAPAFANSSFGATISPGSAFGAQSTQSSGTAQQSNSLFSASKDAGQNTSVFGQPQSTGAFGTKSTSSNLTPSVATPGTAPFGTPNMTSASGNANPFATVSKGTFGDQAASTTQAANANDSGSVFGQYSAKSAFGQSTTSQSPFSQNNSTQAAFGSTQWTRAKKSLQISFQGDSACS
jgi:nucleoporin NUP42